MGVTFGPDGVTPVDMKAEAAAWLADHPNATQHAPLAPSAAARWTNCYGSVAMERLWPEDTESEASREGTAAHWYLSEALEGRFHSIGTLAPNGHPIDQAMQDGAQDIRIDVIDTLRSATPGTILHVEQRVAAPNTIHRDVWGTPDIYLIDEPRRTLHIWDYKYGHKAVSAYRNPQLLCYAGCILDTHGIDKRDWFGWSFSFTIHQPRCYRETGPIDEWYAKGAEVSGLLSNLAAAAGLAGRPDAECRTGPWCANCNAEIRCAANLAVGGAMRDVSMAQIPVDLTPEACGLLLRMTHEAQARLKSTAAALEAFATAQERVPFFERGYVNSRELWTADVSEVLTVMALNGYEMETTVSIPTPAQARKAGVDAAVIAAYSRKPQGAVKLKPVDDTAASRAFGTPPTHSTEET